MIRTVNRSRLYATLVAAFPLSLAVGVILIPVLTDRENPVLLREAASQSLRWFIGYVHAAGSIGIGILACFSIGDILFRKGERRRVVAALPLIGVGGALTAAGLGAFGTGPVALYNAGSDPFLFFRGGNQLIGGLFLGGAITFGLGLLALAFGSVRTGLLRGIWTFVVPTAAIAFVICLAVPNVWGLYGLVISAFLLFIPISLSIRRIGIIS